MKGKTKVILSSIAAILVCASLIAGGTFALFTDTEKVGIAVKAGTVDISASVDAVKLYSATPDSGVQATDDDYAGEIANGKLGAGKYKYEAQADAATDSDGNISGSFADTGKAEFNASAGTLTLDRIVPGDKVTFNVTSKNDSDVTIQCRARLYVSAGLALYNALDVSVGGVVYDSVSIATAWQTVETGHNMSDVAVAIVFPLDAGDSYQGQSTTIQVVVEAVQGNAYTSNEIQTETVSATADTSSSVSGNTASAAISLTNAADGLSVSIPNGTALNAGGNYSSLTLSVTPQTTVSNLNLSSNQTALSYDISLTDANGNAAIDSDNSTDITVSFYVGTGLTGVQLYHNATPIDCSYDSEKGIITFKTSSFSEYSVAYFADYSYETENAIVTLEATDIEGIYETSDGQTVTVDKEGAVSDIAVVEVENEEGLRAALEKENAYIMLTADITLAQPSDHEYNDGDLDTYYLVKITNPVTLDGNGHTVTMSGNNKAMWQNGSIDEHGFYVAAAVDVTFKNLTIASTNMTHAITFAGKCNGTADHVTITTNTNGIEARGESTVTIKDCNITVTYTAADTLKYHLISGVHVLASDVTLSGCTILATGTQQSAYADYAKGIYVDKVASFGDSTEVSGKVTLDGTNSITGDVAFSVDGSEIDKEHRNVLTVNAGDQISNGIVGSSDGGSYKEVVINGGTFTNFSVANLDSDGKDNENGRKLLQIKGGTFDADPSAYVVAGYKVEKQDNGNGTYTYTVVAE